MAGQENRWYEVVAPECVDTVGADSDAQPIPTSARCLQASQDVVVCTPQGPTGPGFGQLAPVVRTDDGDLPARIERKGPVVLMGVDHMGSQGPDCLSSAEGRPVETVEALGMRDGYGNQLDTDHGHGLGSGDHGELDMVGQPGAQPSRVTALTAGFPTERRPFKRDHSHP